jgi:hypothetical protein
MLANLWGGARLNFGVFTLTLPLVAATSGSILRK